MSPSTAQAEKRKCWNQLHLPFFCSSNSLQHEVQKEKVSLANKRYYKPVPPRIPAVKSFYDVTNLLLQKLTESIESIKKKKKKKKEAPQLSACLASAYRLAMRHRWNWSARERNEQNCTKEMTATGRTLTRMCEGYACARGKIRERTLEMKMLSSEGSLGFPECPWMPPLMFMPSFSPGSRWITSSCDNQRSFGAQPVFFLSFVCACSSI